MSDSIEYDYSNQSVLVLLKPSENAIEPSSSASQDSSAVIEGCNSSFDAARFRKSFEYVMYCLTQEKQKSREAARQFVKGGDLLDNSISSVKAASNQLSSSFSKESFMNVTSSIHLYNYLEQIGEIQERHLAGEKELQQLKEEKEGLKSEIDRLKWDVAALKVQSECQKKEKTKLQQKYRYYKGQAAFFKTKVDKVASYMNSRVK